jgi:hypothetical protein
MIVLYNDNSYPHYLQNLVSFCLLGKRTKKDPNFKLPGAEQKFQNFRFVYSPVVHNNQRNQTKSTQWKYKLANSKPTVIRP